MREVHIRDEQHYGPQGPDSNEVAAPEKQTHEEWREEFPYPWDEDAIVTRRDTLRFLVAGAGAMFLATGALAIIGSLPGGPGVQAMPIAKVEELAENEWRVFKFPDQYNRAFLSICRARVWSPTVMCVLIFPAP